MSVEQAIHERWSTYKPLTDLVPVANVATGTIETAPAFPYVTLERTGDAQTSSSTHDDFETVLMIFHVWEDSSLDRAKAISNLIFGRFQRADFDYSRGEVLTCKRTNQLEAKDNETGVWHVLSIYQITAAEPRST